MIMKVTALLLLLPGSIEAVRLLKKAGYLVIVITNQAGISRGIMSQSDLDEIHGLMKKELALHGASIDAIYVCPHGWDEGCNCRKPKPGLLFKISESFKILTEKIVLVGDSERDIESAKNFGCVPILVLTGNGQITLQNHPEYQEGFVVSDLASAADMIIDGI